MTDLITKLFRQIPAGLREVSIFGVLPLYLLIYSLIAIITMRYAGSYGLAKEIRSFRRKSATELIQKGVRRFAVTAFYTTLFLVLMPLFFLFNFRYSAALSALSSDIYSLCSLAIGLTSIVLTVSVVIVLFHKNYYLVFTISDVLKSYHFTGCIGLLLGSCLAGCMCAFIRLYAGNDFAEKFVDCLFVWCMLLCLASGAFAFVIIYRVMFSNRKMELKLLNRLYRVFYGEDKPAVQGIKEWDFEAVRANVEYLCAEYVTAARTVPIHRIEGFGCLCGDLGRRIWDERRRHSLREFMIASVGLWCISMTVTAVVVGNDGTGLLVLDTAVLAAESIPALALYYGKRGKTRFSGDAPRSAGYRIDMKNDRTVFVRNVKFSPLNRYDRFVRAMNSLSAFFYITADGKMDPGTGERAIGVALDWISDVKEKHSCIYLPVFAAGYFAFASGNRFESVRECYRKIIAYGKDADGNSGTEPESGFKRSFDKSREEIIYGTELEDFEEMLKGYLDDLFPDKYPDTDCDADGYLAWLKA